MQPTAILDGILWVLQGTGGWLAEAVRGFSQTAAAMAVTAVWQGVVVAGGLAICLRLAPRTSAGHRFAVWAAGFAMLAGLPFLPLIAHGLAGGGTGVSSGLTEASTKPWIQLDIRWSLAIAALWAVASIYRAVDLTVHTVRLRKLWKSAIPIYEDEGLGASPVNLMGLRGLMGLRSRRGAKICETGMLERPSVIGFLAPRILIPDWLRARLTAGELEQIVLHEAEHLRRRDDWTNLMQKLGLVLFPLNPALWWIERQLCREREMACDEGVVRVTRAPRAYAACLASLAQRGLERRVEALSLGAWQGRPELVHRVHGVLRRRHALSPAAAYSLLGVVGCGLVFGSVELARCPQLIAFAPAPTAEIAQAQTPARPQIEPARLVRTGYAPESEARLVSTAAGYLQANQVKASLPPNHPGMRATARGAEQRARVNLPIASEWKTSVFEMASSPSRQEMRATEARDPRVSAGSEPQWIVLAEWEQVQTSSAEAARRSDYDAGPDASADPGAAGDKGQTNGQAKSKITVTRLIFRVLPAGSISSQPGAAAVRGGWFVIQL